MIRDQEILLNSVYDKQIRSYFKEALDCYNAKAYKACVILSVIAGMDDLFKKIDKLSTEFNDSQRNQFDKIINSRNDSRPFERNLISFCNDDGFGILSRYEIRELEYCFDLRNSFAHPSEEECTAEKARYVFSVMIDLVSSKKMLGGFVYINSLINKIGEPFYYPTFDIPSIISVTSNALDFVDDKKYVVLLEKLLYKLREENSTNYEYFISTLINKIGDVDELNQVINPILSEGKIRYTTFEIFYNLHPEIFQKFDKTNNEKILRSLIQQTESALFLCNIFKKIIETHNDLSEQLIRDVVESTIIHDKTVYNINKETKNALLAVYDFSSKELFNNIVDELIMKYEECDNYCVYGVNFILSLLLSLKECNRKEKLLLVLNNYMTNQTYLYSNPAISDFQNLSSADFELMTNQEIFHLFFSLLESSGRKSFNAIGFVNNFCSYAFCTELEERIDCMTDQDLDNAYKVDSLIVNEWRKIAEQMGDSKIKEKYKMYLDRKKVLEYQNIQQDLCNLSSSNGI